MKIIRSHTQTIRIKYEMATIVSSLAKFEIIMLVQRYYGVLYSIIRASQDTKYKQALPSRFDFPWSLLSLIVFMMNMPFSRRRCNYECLSRQDDLWGAWKLLETPWASWIPGLDEAFARERSYQYHGISSLILSTVYYTHARRVIDKSDK